MVHVAADLAKRVRDRRLRQQREHRRELRHNESRRAPRVAGAVLLPLYRLLIEVVYGTILCEQRRRYVQSRTADGTGEGSVGFASTIATCLLASSSMCDESSGG